MDAEKNISVAIELADEKRAMSEQEKLIFHNVWELKVRGYNEEMILEELAISRPEYNKAIDLGVKSHRPSETDVNIQRDLAVERHLKVLRELDEMAEGVSSPKNRMDKLAILKEYRQTTKELGDIYAIKMPEKRELEITDNTKADDTAKRLIDFFTQAKQEPVQPTLDAEVVEEAEEEPNG